MLGKKRRQATHTAPRAMSATPTPSQATGSEMSPTQRVPARVRPGTSNTSQARSLAGPGDVPVKGRVPAPVATTTSCTVRPAMNAALGILLAGTRVNRRKAASGSRTATTGSLAAARKATTAASPTSRRDAGFQSSTSAVTGTRNQCRFATEEKTSSCPTGTRSTAAATTPRRAGRADHAAAAPGT